MNVEHTEGLHIRDKFNYVLNKQDYFNVLLIMEM